MNIALRRRSREMVTALTQNSRHSAIPSNILAGILEAFMFSHTQNENGTYNTRCLYCFMTVASSVELPQELDRLEKQHICPEKALADLLARETSSRPLVQLH